MSAELMTVQERVVEDALDSLEAAITDGISGMLGLSDEQMAAEPGANSIEVTAYDDMGESLGAWRLTLTAERIDKDGNEIER